MPVYCKIKDYLTAKHKKVDELLENTCVSSLLLPNKYRRGITFVIPSAETIAELEAAIKSDDALKFDKACDILKSHIFPVYLKDAEAWASQQPLQNIIRNIQDVKTKGETITFADGAVIKVDPNFKGKLVGAEKQDTYLAVYEVVKGKLSLGTPQEVDESGKPKPHKPKTGKNELTKNTRCKYLLECLKVKFAKDKYIIQYNDNNISAVECEKIKQLAIEADANRFYNVAFPFLKNLADYDFACLVLLGSLHDEPIISDEVIEKWYKNKDSMAISVTQHCKLVEEEARKRKIIPSGDLGCELDAIKDEILSRSSSAIDYIKNIKGVYQKTLTENCVGEIKPAFPQEFLDFIKERNECKLYLDCHAFCTLIRMREFAIQRDKPMESDIENYITSLFHVESMHPQKSYEDRIKASIFNTNVPELSKRDCMKTLVRFLQSKCFLIQIWCD